MTEMLCVALIAVAVAIIHLGARVAELERQVKAMLPPEGV